MRTLTTNLVLSALVLTASSVTHAEDRIAPEPAPAVQPKIVKPAPGAPIVQPPIRAAAAKWQLTVQEKSLHGEKTWGGASVPSTSNGLRVTLTPEEGVFPSNGPLAFRVELENTLDEPLTLNAAAQLGRSPKLVLAHQKTAAQWSIEGEGTKEAAKPVTIPAGESIAYTIVVKAEGIVQPQPVPLQPQPRPRPLPQKNGKVQPLQVQPLQAQTLPAKKVQVRPIRIQVQPVQGKRIQVQPGQVIVRPAIVAWSQVPVGQGPVRAQLFLEFQREEGDKVWSGRIASKPVDFTIGNARPNNPRPVFRGVPEKAE